MIRNLFLALLIAAAACSSSAGSSSKPGVPPPAITSFTANPATIHAGETATLFWAVTNATQVVLDPGGVQEQGSVQVTPSVTTTYRLTVNGPGGTVSATTTVNVLVSPPVITSFVASPDDVPTGGTTTLRWSVVGATSLSLSDGTSSADVTGQTSATRSLNAPADFTLTAVNSGGSTVSPAVHVLTHSPFLHVQYTNPVSPAAKIRLVKNAASAANRLVLDVQVGAAPVSAFGFAINIPIDASSSGAILLDSALTPAGLLPGIVNIGPAPFTGAVLLGGPAMPNLLSAGAAKHKLAVGEGDDPWPANATLFSIVFKLNGAPPTGNVFLASTATADTRFRAAAFHRDGSEAVSSADVAIGDFIISN